MEKFNISDEGLKLIGALEGIKLSRYQDVAGFWTIGVGHLITGKEKIPIGETITFERAMQLLREDVQLVVDEFNDGDGFADMPDCVTQEEFDACVSLAFNIGLNAMDKSTALRMLNEHNFFAAANAFLMWNKAGGRVVDGLVRRRERERELFLSARK